MSWDELGPSFDETGEPIEPGSDWSPRLTDPALLFLRARLATYVGRAPALG